MRMQKEENISVVEENATGRIVGWVPMVRCMDSDVTGRPRWTLKMTAGVVEFVLEEA